MRALGLKSSRVKQALPPGCVSLVVKNGCTSMCDLGFPALHVKKARFGAWSTPTSLYCTTEQRDWGMRLHCTCYTEPGKLLSSNISIPWCPWSASHDPLLMQTALLSSLLSIITKPQAKLRNVHEHPYCTTESPLKCKTCNSGSLKVS